MNSMENKEYSKPKRYRSKSHKKGPAVQKERMDEPALRSAVPGVQPEATLSPSTIQAVVDAIAEDTRFKDAFHVLQNLLLEHSKPGKHIESETLVVERDNHSGEETEQFAAQIADLKGHAAELENLAADRQMQLEQIQDYVAQLEAQIENFQQQLMKRNVLINSISKERDDIAATLQSKERNFDTMENALNGISAAILGAINQPLNELELRLATACQRKKPLKGDLHAIMTAVCSLRVALEDIDIGGGYGVEIGACVDEETWLKQTPVAFDDNLHARGESGQQVFVRSRGFKYIDALGEEKIIKADVSSADQSDDFTPDNQKSEVSTIE